MQLLKKLIGYLRHQLTATAITVVQTTANTKRYVLDSMAELTFTLREIFSSMWAIEVDFYKLQNSEGSPFEL